jgi:hypothetical protein|tara:strand:- start:585 stop:797 length:213 start_codon:yes stop_codon:yes gene_type:complete
MARVAMFHVSGGTYIRGRPDSDIKLLTFMADGFGSLGTGWLCVVSDISASRNRPFIALFDHSGQGTFRKL